MKFASRRLKADRKALEEFLIVKIPRDINDLLPLNLESIESTGREMDPWTKSHGVKRSRNLSKCGC
ncbi:MAG: hypothetical protein LBG48_00730 [Rickettsiales bacterium]|nr:hypothetical protein [Rickettsiales bacterium]